MVDAVKIDAVKSNPSDNYIVVCVPDHHNGYYITYGYVLAWTTGNVVAELADTPGKEAYCASDFMWRLLKAGIACECIGNYSDCTEPYHVKIKTRTDNY